MSEYQKRAWRRSVARRWATGLFAAAIVAGLLATWSWIPQWAITGGILLFAAFVAFCVAVA